QMSASIETKGVGKAVESIASLGHRAGDIRRTGDAVKRVYSQSNARRFAQSPWVPLAASTIERKRRQGLPLKPLVAKGALMRSLTASSGRGQIDKRENDELRFGSRLYYAAWQQGTIFQPERKIIELSWVEHKMVTNIISRYIAKGETAGAL